MFQTMTINYKARHQIKMLNGQSYAVAPSTMITEGVHTGSRGSLYYPANELAKSAADWNLKPVVINHPTSEDMLEAVRVGFILNTKFQNGKLTAELWLDQAKLAQVDRRVLNAVLQNKIMEVSTGLNLFSEKTSGNWLGKPYNAIAKDYRPHHLAILPDNIGACSAKVGCGLLQNQNEREPIMNVLEVLNVQGIIATPAQTQPGQTEKFLTMPKMDFAPCCNEQQQQTTNTQTTKKLDLPKMTF